jgi:hypothetical protein
MSLSFSLKNTVGVVKKRWKPWHVWVLGALAALLILQVYFIRELLAALILFTVLFLVVAVFTAIAYAIGRAGEAGFAYAEPTARRGLEAAEDLSRKTFRRPRSVPAP